MLILMSPDYLIAVTDFTVDDEVTMSGYIKASTSADELRLFIKLFPDSPFTNRLEGRLFQIEHETLSFEDKKKLSQFEQQIEAPKKDTSLSGVDEVTMSRLAQTSKDPKMYRLFLKIFPGSSFAPIFKQKLSRLENKGAPKKTAGFLASILPGSEEENLDSEESVKQIEDKILAKESLEKAPPAKPEEEKEPDKAVPEKEKAPEVEPPEPDWSKIEVGIPTEIALKNSSGSAISTSGSPTGIYLGWSDEIWFDTGWGTGMNYFVQKLGSNAGEYQHLYFEAGVKGRILKFFTWGLSFGSGVTTASLNNAPSDLIIVPGQGTIQSISMGGRYGSFGVNMMTNTFTGSYTWEKGLTSSGEVKWTGTVTMIVMEYNY
ncbi:MAG: hypothetical protein GY786_04260 [Proteobacteria bacterium]|nr:hypothetical protein [Pseudomonadota bacterium]